MDIDGLVEEFPVLFHMAVAGSWGNIKKYGLLSTTALLDLYEINQDQRRRIESEHRPECVTISNEKHGIAIIRDQKPMSTSGLEKALLDGITPKEWYEKLNSMTFFWASEKRLHTLLNARAYRNQQQDVLTIDTKSLVEKHKNEILLSPYNSGSTKPNPFKRGRDTFLPIDLYPFEEWSKKRSSNEKGVVEVCVNYGVPTITEMVVKVCRMQGSETLEVLYERK